MSTTQINLAFAHNTCSVTLAFQDHCSVAFEFEEAPAFALSTPEAPSFMFDADAVVCVDWPEYNGAYMSTPRSTEQVYATDSRRMTDDFTVCSIPVYHADNDSGVTVTIAES